MKSSDLNDSDDIDKIATTKTERIKPKRGGKKGIKSSDDSSGNNDISDSEKTEDKAPLQINIEQKDVIGKPKRGRKIVQKSPSPCNEEENIKTGDVPNGLPDNPESGKNDIKPTAVKRKTKAKPAKK